MQFTFTFFIRSMFFGLLMMWLQSATAQQNGGLESWSPSGSPPPFDWKYPTGWTTTNASTEFITAGVTRSTDKHSGSYAAQIKSLNIFGTNHRGQMALGLCEVNFAEYEVKGFTGGEPLGMRPERVTFFYKFVAGGLTQKGGADLLIKRNSNSMQADTVYHHSLSLDIANTYTAATFEIPVDALNILPTDSIVLVFSSSDSVFTELNTLFVDDVSIDFVSATDRPSRPEETVKAYPNPIQPGEVLTVTHPSQKWDDVKIIDPTGKIVRTCFDKGTTNEFSHLISESLSPGMYFILADGKYTTRFVVHE